MEGYGLFLIDLNDTFISCLRYSKTFSWYITGAGDGTGNSECQHPVLFLKTQPEDKSEEQPKVESYANPYINRQPFHPSGQRQRGCPAY
jgi:hypothetical protein